MSEETETDYAAAKARELMTNWTEARPPSEVQRLVRLAIAEAMRDQRYECIEAVQQFFLGRHLRVLRMAGTEVAPREAECSRIVALIQNATVKVP